MQTTPFLWSMWLNFAELQIDKAATRQAQRGPVSAASDIARQVTIEKCHVANKICISSHFEILFILSTTPPMSLEHLTSLSRFPFLKNSSKLHSERFQIRADNGSPMKAAEFRGVIDSFYLLAQAFRDSLKPYFQGFENILLL